MTAVALLLFLAADDSMTLREALTAGKGLVKLRDGSQVKAQVQEVNLLRRSITLAGPTPLTKSCEEIAAFAVEPEARRAERQRKRRMLGWGVAAASLAVSFRFQSNFVSPGLFVISPAVGWAGARALVPRRPKEHKLVCP